MHHDYMKKKPTQIQLRKALKSDNILRKKGPFNNTFEYRVAEIPGCHKKARLLFQQRAVKDMMSASILLPCTHQPSKISESR